MVPTPIETPGRPKYRPCETGPETFRDLDEAERRGLRQFEYRGEEVNSERIAEIWIADCSRQLAKISAFAAVSHGGVLRGLESRWRQNLHFMEWWLSNHRERETAKKTRPVH